MCPPRGAAASMPALVIRGMEVGGDEAKEVARLLRMSEDVRRSGGLCWLEDSETRVSMPKVGRVVMTPGATLFTPVSRDVERGEYTVGIFTTDSWAELVKEDMRGL